MKNDLIEIFDENEKKTGEKMLISEAHAKSLWHQIAHVWVVNSASQILLQKRAADKKVFPNLWDVSAGGHVDVGEDTLAAGIRELSEEVGINVKPERAKFIHHHKFVHQMPGGWTNRIFIWSYKVLHDVDIAQLKLEEEEVSEVQWFEPKKLIEMLDDPVKVKELSPDIYTDARILIKELQ